MNDPHVVALLYKVAHSEDVNFKEAEPREFETSQFIAKVEDGTARIALKLHFGSVKEARAAVEPFLHLWALWDALNPLLSGFRLEYSMADVIDRNPPPGNYINMVLQPPQMSARGAVWDGSFGCYPEPPPEQAALDADIEVMAFRHWLYRQGRDTLGAMAYFCLTVTEANAPPGKGNQRRRAAQRYNVDFAVLDKLGELTSTRGGRDARKRVRDVADLTPSERMWIEDTVVQLIRRAADLAGDPDQDLPTITRLPSLPEK